MNRNLKSNLGIMGFLVFSLVMISVPAVSQPDYERRTPDQNMIQFTLKGGYAHMESRNGLVDLNAEIQLRFSSHIYAGFGVGYLSNSDNMHMGGFFGGHSDGLSGNMMGGMMGVGSGGMTGGFTGHDHSFFVVPLTLSLYYVLPAGSNLNVFMVGGGGYYLGSFRDISTQTQNAFGPHFGVGLDFKITERIALLAEGIYRFVNLKDFTSDLHPGFRESTDGMDGLHEEGSWHFHHGQEEWHFHEEHQEVFQDQAFVDAGSYNLNLNGFSLRAGLKFSF